MRPSPGRQAPEGGLRGESATVSIDRLRNPAPEWARGPILMRKGQGRGTGCKEGGRWGGAPVLQKMDTCLQSEQPLPPSPLVSVYVPNPCLAARRTRLPRVSPQWATRRDVHGPSLSSSLSPGWVRGQARGKGRKAAQSPPSYLPQLTFEKDKTPILALVGSTDVTGQTTPEVPDGHGVVVQDPVVPDPPEPAALGRAWV